MKTSTSAQRLRRSRSSGAVTIEFALLIGFFIVVAYATISFALLALVKQTLTHAAVEGARAGTTKVDRLKFTTVPQQRAQQSVLAKKAAEAAADWLIKYLATVTGQANYLQIETVWAGSTTAVNTGVSTINVDTSTLTVTVTYPNYLQNPMVPTLMLPGIGAIPDVPGSLQGKAAASL